MNSGFVTLKRTAEGDVEWGAKSKDGKYDDDDDDGDDDGNVFQKKHHVRGLG